MPYTQSAGRASNQPLMTHDKTIACVVAAPAFALNFVVSCAAAQSPGENSPPVEPETVTVLDARPVWLEAVPVEPKDPTTAAAELCRDKLGDPNWLSQVRAGLYRTMCSSAAWFDGFFGNARFDDEYEAMHGSVAVGAGWDEHDHWDPSVRFRARVRLPQLSERFDAFVGKVDPEEYVTELRDDFDTLPRQFARAQDDAVLFGLGYGKPGRRGGHFDAGVGAKLGWPLEPYAKGTYRYARPFLDRNLLRLRETIFWEEQEHFGVTTRVDLERLLAEDYLLRWTSSGTLSEKTEGVRWYSSLTLYHSLGNGRAFAYQGGISGESDREVEIVDYGLRVIFRRRIYREWLFLELRSSITWPRETLLERRESNLGAGAAIELMFGERNRK
jgi:hypothetical protein